MSRPSAPLTSPLELDLAVPTEQDIAWAYECLRPVPFSRSPVAHVSRILARFRETLESQQADRPVVGEG